MYNVHFKSDQYWQDTKVIYVYVYTGHPTCLDMNTQLVAVIQTYPWQCMECKTCIICRDPFDEVEILSSKYQSSNKIFVLTTSHSD